MHRHQHRSQNLITFTVKPGSETGLYYITVANLAHSTTWRDLKAFAAQACEVDHAEVYPPTSGFVRVKGRANFEKAFKHLDGNTLEYRALQADGRNVNQDTVVKLPPTDYHAARILRGDTGRIFSEDGSPILGPSAATGAPPAGAGAVAGSPPSLDYQGSASPAFSLTPPADSHWAYIASASYVPSEGYQAATVGATPPPPGSVPFEMMTGPAHAFPHRILSSAQLPGPPPVGYQALAAQAPFGSSPAYYSGGGGYDVGGHAYPGYIPPTGHEGSRAYAAGYSGIWPSPEPAQPPALPPLPPPPPSTSTSTGGPGPILHSASDRPAVVIEQRKIIIRYLARDGLSESVVAGLVASHTGLGARPGEIERVELPINKDGRARGTAFVTFAAPALASAAVAALDGREVAGRKLSARLAEGVPPAGAGGGSSSTYASGSSGSGSGSAAAGNGGGGQKSRKEEPPVIVDGSGGRWKKGLAPVVVDGSAGKKGNNGGQRGARH
ncbi:613b2c64-0787-4e3d-beb5-db5126e9aa6f [Thermothielavioides terrestris]|uniref:613b2c64-0787-4e3d-beb5-db5126e9aa6f n=1 Tax=Thermothielavioides terrestris TaxID=2587410 RepID=A0A3S4F2R1_9PEZI|nr:613b2c64-0787-4e3d-beb5-db5126e9aa6f [Thermothielavioides terrestris]